MISIKDFKILKIIGNGPFGHIYMAKYNKDEIIYALKVLNKQKLNKKKSLKYAVG